MTSSPSPVIAPHPALARLLAALSIVLLVVFLASVLVTAAPPRLLEPQWQLTLIAALVNSASLALMGALLLPLAVWVDPANQRLRARRNAWRRWCLAAAIGFLLLVPLQGVAGWRLYRTVTGSQQQQLSQASQKLADLRQAISSATSHQELQERVQQLFGPNAGLSPADATDRGPGRHQARSAAEGKPAHRHLGGGLCHRLRLPGRCYAAAESGGAPAPPGGG